MKWEILRIYESVGSRFYLSLQDLTRHRKRTMFTMWGINSLLQSGFSVQLNGYWLLPKYKYQCYTLGIFYLVILVITRHHRWIALLIAFSPQWTSIVSSDTMRISSQRGGFQVSAPQLFQVLCPKCVLLEQQGLTFMILEVTQARSNSQHGFGCLLDSPDQWHEGRFLVPGTRAFVRQSVALEGVFYHFKLHNFI